MTCNKVYVSQTSRSLKQRYKEHTHYIKSNNPQSAYALHILHSQHEYGPIEKTLTLLKPLKNPFLLTPYEHFFIHHSTKQEGSFPSKTPANLTHCSSWPSTPPILLHDPASWTVTFTVHTARVPAPHIHSQHNQVCTRSVTKSPSHLYWHNLYSPHPSTPHPPWQRLITPTPHTSHQAGATHASQHPRPIHQTWQTQELDTN